jgi:glycosyltransferase involved in cell wall biosynthesis
MNGKNIYDMISVIIPTYKEPEVLDLCLKSAISGQKYQNQLIVVVDGFYNLNKNVLDKYKDIINILNLEENVGLNKATNLGVYNSYYDKILIVNDDNVFPQDWDIKLLEVYQENSVITPNQIEPTPSIFRQFHIKDLGRAPNTFDLQKFWDYSNSISHQYKENEGSTLPIFISKKNYLKVGGWDESYPGAWVVDWDFFLKCELSGMEMVRSYNCHFYHFVSISTEFTSEDLANKQYREKICHEYFKYKWGTYAQHNPKTNSKMLDIYI